MRLVTVLSIGLTTRCRDLVRCGAKPFATFTAGVAVNLLLGFVLSTHLFVGFGSRLGQ